MKRVPIFFIFCLLVASGVFSHAQEVTTALSNSQPHVGQPIQLLVTIRGARGAELPQTLAVKDLRINRIGQSTQFEMRNMKMSSSVTYTYMVVPQAEGEFTIPSFDVRVEGRIFRTQPVQLSVGAWTRTPAPSVSPGQAPVPQNMQDDEAHSSARPYFAELLVPKKKVYVGEVVPAELRFYFDSRYGGQVGERPTFGGEGFTVQKLSNANKRELTVNGDNYVVFSFQTSITPVKAGILEIPSSQLPARLQLPGNSTRSLPDIFRDFGGMFGETQDVTLETKPVSLEVIPLPKEGRPEDFSGAIGQFTLEASVSPKKATAGEPVTLRAIIAGQGNFEAMGAPVLTSDEGWRTYPPSDKFEASDAINFSGEKAFEFPIIARQNQTKTPSLSFSYFDPATEKYVTLTQEPFDVQVEAASASSTPVATPAMLQAASTPAATVPDITAMAGGASSWRPLLFRREFLIVNGGFAAAWLIAFCLIAFKKFASSPTGLKMSQRRKVNELFSRVRHADDESFYGIAGAYVCARLGADGDAFTAATRLDASSLSDDLKVALRRILERQGELKYAASGAAKPSDKERLQVDAALKEFDAKYEK